MKSWQAILLFVAALALGMTVAWVGHDSFKLSVSSPDADMTPAQGATGNGGENDENGNVADKVGPVVHFDPFVVSQPQGEAEGDDEHMSTVTFDVEMDDTGGREALKARRSEVRSVILNVLADAKLNDIGDPEDLANLKKKVQERVQSVVAEHAVRRVLITEFLSM